MDSRSTNAPDRQNDTPFHRLTILSDLFKEISMASTRIALILCAGLGLGLTLYAQEKITLSVAETKPSNAEYRMGRITEDHDDPNTPGDEGQINILLVGQNGESLSCVYNATSNPTATFLLNGQNKANFSSVYAGNATTGSRRQRLYHRLVVMGESTAVCGKTITGSLAGAVP